MVLEIIQKHSVTEYHRKVIITVMFDTSWILHSVV